MEDNKGSSKLPPQIIPSLPRDSRGSLEVFNPATFSPKAHPKPASPFATWQSSTPSDPNPPSWPAISQTQSISLGAPASASSDDVGTAAKRAAEWGLVLRTDEETGTLQGVEARPSCDRSNRTSGGLDRSNRSSSDDEEGIRRGNLPRVSEELRDALSAFQQTFVVSDATRPDYPILYASAGFFNMTGYTSKEVIGRNCRFLQGAGTDMEEIAKIREALPSGTSYCGRVLNYKKDGTPFWNLLTIAPIKDEEGNTLKFIGMQVEVSKYTEGSKDTMVRPNGLPESLIRYDERQKDKARSSVSELVSAVKRPRSLSLSESLNLRKSEGSGELFTGRRNSENAPSSRRNSGGSARNSLQKISEVPEKVVKKTRKSDLLSFMG